jgi:tRNA pseudouridine38-40 synthase
MRNIKLTMEYDGTDYVGWQRQTNGLSIQQVIEEAIEEITGETVKVNGSGRTDSGVHALGQTANFLTGTSIPTAKIPAALNSVLPRDIVIKDAQEMPLDFHARFSCKAKEYRYQVYNGETPTAIMRRYCYHVPRHLDLDAMAGALKLLEGTHDFTCFKAAGSSVENCVRHIYRAKLSKQKDMLQKDMLQKDMLVFTFKGNGFLYNMVRIMVGTVLQTGMGKRPLENISQLLKARDRTLAGPTAPAKGLFLVKVYY